MSIAIAAPVLTRSFAVTESQRFDIGGVSYDQYEIIADALPDFRGIRMLYLDGELTFLTLSRRHDWISDAINDLIKAVAVGFRLEIAMGGRATFRKREMAGGIEGDQTYYFGEHARIMRGGVDIDLAIQSPPDLAVEVEVTHSADRAMGIWGRLGVPEVWRFREETWSLTFWHRRDDGTYAQSDRSLVLPSSDVQDQVRRSDEIPFNDWYLQLHVWVRDVLVPRYAGGG